MGPGLLTLTVLSAPLPQPPDTATYSSPAAQPLVARAMARHRVAWQLPNDLRIEINWSALPDPGFRLDLVFGARR